jgi:hypothetical protein
MVGAFGDSPGGNLVFNMDEGLPPPPPPQIDVAVTVTGGSVDPATGRVTISGEITCSEPALGFVFGEVRQRVGRQYIYGYYDAPIECGVEPIAWSATSFVETGLFRAGMVRVTGGAIVFDGAGGGSVEANLRLLPTH